MKENYQKQLDALLAALPPEGKPRLLLQSCCGPCSSYVLEYLTRYFRVTVLYYNPNIQPRDEYDRRLYWQRELIRQLPTPEPVDLLACDYDGQRYIDAVRGLEREPEGGAPWYAWPQPLRDRSAAALERLDDRVLLHAYLQTEFTRQWDAVRAYAHAHGVRIIGDLPMYVAPDSADVWAQPAQFRLDPDGQPSAVAGVPPDYFSADGQLWGNPLYDWDAMRADGFRWWKDRIRGAAKRYDVVRIDHFRAISSYWVVPRGELTARGGHWAPGPGPALLQALHTAAPELELIAEDLGTIDDDVRRLVARSGCPGMRVLLFGFDPSGTSEHRPDRVRARSVCYVGTHDNAPAAAWAALGGADADYAMRCLGVYDVARLPEALLRTGMGSRAELFIAQMQDVLGLGAESRMNTPGTAAGNWVWRLLPGQADAQTAARLLARTQAACRA